MNKTNLELRKVLIRMLKLKKPIPEIVEITGIKQGTVYSYARLFAEKDGEAKILYEPPKNTRKPTFDINALKAYFETDPFAFNKEIAKVFDKSKSTIQRWRNKLGFRRKKAKTSYKEADLELKKNS